MRVAYVDTSCLVSVAFAETSSEAVVREFDACDELVSSNVLEAELRAALRREDVEGGADALLGGIGWVLPDRRLTPEIERALAVGYLRGVDLWHVAAALYLAESPRDVIFLTLDQVQGKVAAELGFRTPL